MTDTVIATAAVPAEQSPSRFGEFWVRFRRHKAAVVGLCVFLFIVLAVAVGPLVYWIDPATLDVRSKNQGPSLAHLLGTDNLGRDTLAQLLTGGRVTLAVGFTAMFLSILVGTTVGLVSGYFRRFENLLMRVTDLFLALPVLPLLLVMIMLFRDTLRAAFGPSAGIFILLVVAMGITSWMHAARIVRGAVLSIKNQEFILAAKSGGTREINILRRHILPNVANAIMVSATLGIATAIVAESALSFLGLGFPSDFPTWGRLLYDGTNFIQLTPSRVIWPGLAISLTVLSVNYIGDAVRDAMDPRAHRS
ncbi:ABC transporter permease [Mesorhizobium sp. LjNodule214]|uniref:ABC transporter permease n=1 Tax=Mesorhizobium sp. LjNodule214 TaxID=3342252 RepID=UPI003ECCE5AF